jgi:hypothetical protein
VKTYTVYVHDHRYAAPTLLLADFASDERAREFAAQRLAASAHYFAIEVWEDEGRLLRFDKAESQTP